MQNIKFSITAPSRKFGFRNAVERMASDYAGDGLGAVHQWLLCEAVTKDSGKWLRGVLTIEDTECLTAGIVYNDFPVVDEYDCAGYRKLLERIDASSAEYITDASFRLQPTQAVRFALAIEYKQLPSLFNTMFGVDKEACDVAGSMLELRTRDARTHYHFMKRNKDESIQDVIRQALSTTTKWFRAAMQPVLRSTGRVNYFLIGHITHTWTDSFSAGHTLRGKPDAGAIPVHSDDGTSASYVFADTASVAALKDMTVLDIYFFGDQTDQSHGELESWTAVSRDGSEPQRRAIGAIAAVRELLFLVRSGFSALEQNRTQATFDAIMARFAALSYAIFDPRRGKAPGK